ncbi:MAG: FlgD immunoglobulin-like domain containing protein [Symbiobacteriia bacterium]
MERRRLKSALAACVAAVLLVSFVEPGLGAMGTKEWAPARTDTPGSPSGVVSPSGSMDALAPEFDPNYAVLPISYFYDAAHTETVVDVHAGAVDASSLGGFVRTVFRGSESAGYHSHDWDGRNGAGQIVPPGLYTVHVHPSNTPYQWHMSGQIQVRSKFEFTPANRLFDSQKGESLVLSHALYSFHAGVSITVENLAGSRVRQLFSGDLSQGRYTVSWDGCDGAGNLIGDGDYYFWVRYGDAHAYDQKFPVTKFSGGASTLRISGLGVTDVTATSAVVSFQSSVPADGSVEYGTVPGRYGSVVRESLRQTSHRIVLEGLGSGKTYYLRAAATDGTNSATSPEVSFSTMTDSRPTITGVMVAPGVSTATVTFHTSVPCSAEVDFGVSGTYGKTVSGSAGTTAHSVRISGLLYQMTYDFRVRVRDAAGNEGVWTGGTFTTSAYPMGTAGIKHWAQGARKASHSYDGGEWYTDGVPEATVSTINRAGCALSSAAMAIYPRTAHLDLDERTGLSRDAPADPYTIYRANQNRINAYWYDIGRAFGMSGIKTPEKFIPGSGSQKAQRIYNYLSTGLHPLAEITYYSSRDNAYHTHWVIFLDYTGTDLVPRVLPPVEAGPMQQDATTFNPEDPDTIVPPGKYQPPVAPPPPIAVVIGAYAIQGKTSPTYLQAPAVYRGEKFVIHDPGQGAAGKDIPFSQNRTGEPLDSVTELVTYIP